MPKFDLSQAGLLNGADAFRDRIGNGVSPLRSGDIAIMLQPAWFEGDYAAHAGTTHGSGWSYDTHVPLLWMGWKIKNGSSAQSVNISDIAVTVADLLRISHPNGAVGDPISDMISNP